MNDKELEILICELDELITGLPISDYYLCGIRNKIGELEYLAKKGIKYEESDDDFRSSVDA